MLWPKIAVLYKLLSCRLFLKIPINVFLSLTPTPKVTLSPSIKIDFFSFLYEKLFNGILKPFLSVLDFFPKTFGGYPIKYK